MTAARQPVFSVIVPTYGRPVHAAQCIESLREQAFSGNYEILVVHRPTDEATVALVAGYASDARVVAVTVVQPGFLPALRAGMAAATGDFVAFTDDDALYPSNWLAALADMLRNEHVHGAGGLIVEAGKGVPSRDLGRIAKVTLTGRLHFGLYDSYPQGRVEVDFLCGANMAYRRSALSTNFLPDSVGIHGGAPGNETLLGALVRRQGGVLLCDTRLGVRHVRAERAEGSRRDEQLALRDLSRTRTFILRHALSRHKRLLLAARASLVGDHLLPGLVRTCVPGRRRRSWHDVTEVLRGMRDGWREPLIG